MFLQKRGNTMENEKEYYKEEIVKMLQNVEDVKILVYLYAFIRKKIKAE